MKQTLDQVRLELESFQGKHYRLAYTIPTTSYRPLVRYQSYAVRLAAKLEDVLFDAHHENLLENAVAKGRDIYPMSLIRGDIEQFQSIISTAGLIEPSSYKSPDGVRVPVKHIFGLFAVMDASQIMTDKMINIFKNTDYMMIMREAKKEGNPYQGPSTLSEFITLRWSVPYIERRLGQDLSFNRGKQQWTKAVKPYLAL